jgi:hypothetical protein
MANFSLLAKFGVDTKSLENGLRKADKHVSVFRRSMAKAGAVLRSFGPAIGGIGFTAMARSAINLGSKISDMAVQLNIGATELQVLEFAAREAGVEVSVMERALRNVQLRTQEAINGNKSYGKAFERLGIDINEFNKLPTEKKLEAVAIAQKEATDKAAAFNDVAIILGQRAGPAMQEVLQNLAGPKGYGGLEAAAKRANEVMSDETIAEMDKAADTIESFKRKITVLSAEGISGFTDGLKVMAGWLKKLKGEAVEFDEFEKLAQQSLLARDEFEKFGILDRKIFGLQSQRSKEKEARNMAKLKERADELRESFKKLNDEEKAIVKGEPIRKSGVTGGNKAEEKTPEELRKEKLEELKGRIKDMQLEQLRAQEKGDKKAADSLKSRIALMERSLGLMKKFGIGMEEAAKLAAADLLKEKEAKKPKPTDETADKPTLKETLEKKIEQIEMARIRAQAAGDKEAEESLARRLEMAKEVMRLMAAGFSQEEATKLANDLTTTGQPADTRGDFAKELTGHDLRRAANKAADKGTHFDRMTDGTFQKFVNGSKKGRFTEAQMQAGLEKRIEKDPTQKTLKRIETILEGKFVNE